MNDRDRETEPWPADSAVERDVSHTGEAPGAADARIGHRFAGRFLVRRRLGAGGSGTVYEALDESRGGAPVALKVLHRAGAHSAYRLKSEFRALRDVSHPQLVSLLELVADGDDWFFTMELVRGVPFDQYVRGVTGLELDPERLASALTQLVVGLQALHGAGRIHRDIKPSNVLVEPEGRLVIVDFGLVRLAERRPLEPASTEAGFVGTPAYAAPEQYLDTASVTAAADWYAVGVMLYEALTGRCPERDDPAGPAGIGRPARHVRELCDDVPEALCEACMALLDPQARTRATGARLLEALSLPSRDTPRSCTPGGELVGRQQELDVLRAALERVRRGRPAALCLGGVSGMGKSSVLEAFLQTAEWEHQALVLRSRCQIYESVPYKAFDALVEALCGYLNGLPAVRAAALLPRNAHLMVQVFPAMRRVNAIADLPPGRSIRRDFRDERELALGAFKQLLAAIADHAPLVLSIDDMQWGDVDSARLLRLLLSPPDAPTLLFVGAFRSEDEDSSAALRELLAQAGQEPILERLQIEPLEAEDTEALVRQYAPGSDEVVRAIGLQSGGHPFYAVELARSAASTRRSRDDQVPIGLEAMVESRVRGLSEPARHVLAVASVAGASVPEGLLRQAAEVEGLSAFHELRSARMLREQDRGGELWFTTYHDRIREVVEAGLQEALRRDAHLRLARLGEASGAFSAEQLVLHYRASGAREDTHRLALKAAAHATETHAYFQAADMLRIALEHGDGEARAVGLRLRLARALALSGQREEAGAEYDAVADACTDPEERFRMRVDAMRQWLLVRHPRGRALLEQLSASEGLPLRRMHSLGTAWDMARGMIAGRRGRDLVTDRSAELTPRERRQVTLCWAGMTALVLGDSAQLAQSMAYAMRLVSRFGTKLDPELRMVTWTFVSLSWPVWWGRMGPRAQKRFDALLAAMNAREGTDLPLVAGGMDAALSLQLGYLHRCAARAEPLLDYPTRTDVGATWTAALRMGLSVTYFFCGRWRDSVQGGTEWRRWARERGDSFLEQHLLVTGVVRHLLADAPQRARRDYDHVERASEGRHPILYDPWWPAWIDLYEGRVTAAIERFRAARARTPLWDLGDRAASFFLFHVWESASLVRARLEGGRRLSPWRVRVKLWLSYLHPTRTAPAARLHLRALLASLRGSASLPDLLRRAADAWDQAEHRMFAAALRARLATHLEGDEAQRTWAQALARFTEQGADNPRRLVDALASGLREGPWRPPPAQTDEVVGGTGVEPATSAL